MKKKVLAFPKSRDLTQAIRKAKKESLRLFEDQGLAAISLLFSDFVATYLSGKTKIQVANSRSINEKNLFRFLCSN